MFKDILLTLVGLIGVAMIVVTVLSEKENKDKCNENKRVKEYNGVVLIGGIATIVIILVLFFMGRGNKSTTRFAFG